MSTGHEPDLPGPEIGSGSSKIVIDYASNSNINTSNSSSNDEDDDDDVKIKEGEQNNTRGKDTVSGYLDLLQKRKMEGAGVGNSSLNSNFMKVKNSNSNGDTDVPLSLLRVEVEEGKHRMVRRILHNVGHSVVALHRVRIGEINLCNLNGVAGDAVGADLLPPGQARPCTTAEMDYINRLIVEGQAKQRETFRRKLEKQKQLKKESEPPKRTDSRETAAEDDSKVDPGVVKFENNSIYFDSASIEQWSKPDKPKTKK